MTEIDLQETQPATGFAELGLDERLVSELAALGYEEPTPIQREAIPTLLAGRDVLGQAATGTGKTAAFALPLLERVVASRERADEGNRRQPAGLVLVPTRELATQVAEAVHRYGRRTGVRVLPIYGGAPMQQQLRALERGVDVVVATPGRAMDHVRRGTLKLDRVCVAVLDEADEMLDIGFAEELEAILGQLPPANAGRQTALFSATMAPRVRAIADRHMTDPVVVRIATVAAEPGSMPRVRQAAYIVPRAHKRATLARVLDMEAPQSAIVFCRTRNEVDELTEVLGARGYGAEAIHGGMSQDQRERVMRRFKEGALDVLVATDVAARGLDIKDLSHVINYDVPAAAEVYVHRIGRTGRAGREGVAITIAEPREHRLLRNVEHLTKQKIEMCTVPTVADLRARRLELTRASLEELLVEAAGGGAGEEGRAERDPEDGGPLEQYRVVVDSLAEEYDLMDVAAAAVRMAYEAATPGDGGEEEDIPTVQPRERGERQFADRFEKSDRARKRDGRFRERFEREEGPRPPADRSRPGGGEGRGPRAEGRARREPSWDTTRIYVGAGRATGVRPGDIVGAIANEAGVPGNQIGAIQIADRFSLVEVPSAQADDVIQALKGTTIKGKRVAVRRDRER
jgi:ATP-dependent RNA helicase DeaD